MSQLFLRPISRDHWRFCFAFLKRALDRASSRLRDRSRVGEIEKARTRKQNARKVAPPPPFPRSRAYIFR